MKDNTRKTLKYYWQIGRNHKIILMVAVSVIAIANIVDSIIPIYFKEFFNIFSTGDDRQILAKGLLSTLGIIGLLNLTRWLFWRVGDFTINFWESISMRDLSKRCFDYLHQHSYAYFSNNFTGSTVKRIKSFVSSFEVLVDQLFFELLTHLADADI